MTLAAWILISLMISGLISFLFRAQNSWNRHWMLFAILSIGAWFGHRWLVPIGQEPYGLFLFPPILIAVLIALILAAWHSHEPRSTRNDVFSETQEEARGIKGTWEAISIYFWVSLSLFILFMLIGTLYPSPY